MDSAQLLDFLAATLRIAAPLILAALGGIICERAGTFAVGLEGQMLAGAFLGVLATHAASNAGFGLIASAAGGAMMAGVVAIATVRYHAEHMVTGIASNILALGLTSFLLRAVAGNGGAPTIRVPLLEVWAIPGLSELPFVGALLFRQPPLTYLALALVVPLFLFLFRTRVGLDLRAVGENPVAAFAAGGDPARVRTAAILAGGALAGLAGAVLSLQQVGTFTDGMTGGRGYLVLAAIIVGRWMPLGSLLACLMFGAAEAMSLRVQAFSLPVSSYVIQMAPYLAALLVLAGLGRGTRMPAAIGQPFRQS
ncbi:ABC transporter permease [Comamonas sp. CAH-2]|jgi:simple sugar transport system permease protein|uniref:ABC transporter permease n=1 Tax=Comamonas sp. CAH-2 TaxID=2605745 RepID=UPI0012AE8E2F|nr:ABC transporter permease [Comamonas sp. CAH-2]MRT21604.1 ABC transporter permease [Comamonas sp. CAH-2]